MYSIGYDLGSSSIKAAIIEVTTGKVVSRAFYPESEMKIEAPYEGWAEQDPELWWQSVCKVTKQLIHKSSIDSSQIKSIGIAYQMHGLVLVDKDQNILRPSIIWCDSRAIAIGEKAFENLGSEYCFKQLLNSPGNFTASKLRWVEENEPDIFERIDKIMLPGDYLAMKFSGVINTTRSGLSEGIFWDFKNHKIATKLLDQLEISERLIPDLIETFELQGKVSLHAAEACGLTTGTPITYRGGDQPNNAMSLNVLNPGEIAATGGTSGVVYGVSDLIKADTHSKVNSFAHVNHTQSQTRIGQLLCINGAGSQYAWIKKQIAESSLGYSEMEERALEIPIGSDGLSIIPFGNGAERMLNNVKTGAHINNVQFNIHTREHFYRAALEGIAFSFVYGIKAMEDLGIVAKTMRVGNDNLFQSKTFAMTICNLLGCQIEMMDTTGAVGAAKASRIGIGEFDRIEEAIESTQRIKTYEPENSNEQYKSVYEDWKVNLSNIIEKSLT